MADAVDIGAIATGAGAFVGGAAYAVKKLFLGNGKESNGHRSVADCKEIHRELGDRTERVAEQNTREHAELHEKFNKVASDVAFIRGFLEHRGGAS